MKKYYVYTLLSINDKKPYTGFISNLRKRLQEHTGEGVESIENHRPSKLIHHEYFINEGDARASKVFLKSGFGRNKIRQTLKNICAIDIFRGLC